MLLCGWIDGRQLYAVPTCYKSNKNREYVNIMTNLKDNHGFTMIENNSVILAA